MMRSPAAAIAWELGQRHRWGLLAIGGYLLALAAIALIVQPGDLEDSDRFALTVVVPMTWAWFYLLTVFCFGLSGDLAGRESTYPARMFALPVSTPALAGWPMLYGAIMMSSLWMATAIFALRPWGVHVPLVWPALFAAAFLAWTQVLMWMPYGLRQLRVILAVSLLITADVVVILGINYRVSDLAMIAGIAPLLPLAFLAARFALIRARRGDVPDWRLGWTAEERTDLAPGRPAHFSSAARAQLWFEWREHGRSLPVLVAILLPFELALLFLPGGDGARTVLYTLLLVLLTPRMMSAFAAARIRSASPEASDTHEMSPFMAARPATTAALVAAKLQMTLVSTLLAWLVVLVVVPLALTLADAWPVVNDAMRQTAAVIGRPRTIALVVLVLTGMMASTWKQLVQGLCIGLTGREWLIRTNTVLTLLVTASVLPLSDWILGSSAAQAALWDALPWIPAGLVALKMTLATWVAVRLHRSRLLSDRLLVTGAAVWMVTVLALYGVFAWAASALIPYALLLLAILFVPLGRVSAAPLALAWNRHR